MPANTMRHHVSVDATLRQRSNVNYPVALYAEVHRRALLRDLK